MGKATAFEIVSESFVKPSTPTPPSLRTYKLCSYDQFASKMYIPVVFFYPNHLNPQEDTSDSPMKSSTSEILETALSKTLSYYPPFAGRLRDNLYIECNDMGVHFISARIKCPMTEFLQPSNPPNVKDLVFHKSFRNVAAAAADDSLVLVLVQLSYFDYSGMAVSVCMSHKLGDASNFSTFMHDWAALVDPQSSHIPSPQFIGASLYPPLEDKSLMKEFITLQSEVPIRKFLFPAPKIALLKDLAAKSGVENPTRVEVVSALLYRCAMLSSMAISGSFRPAFLVLPMSLRPIAALPKDSIGNFGTQFSIKTTNEDELTFPELVFQLRNAKVKVRNGGSCSSEFFEYMMNETPNNKTVDLYSCGSWCRFPFYDVDFGWGKPLSLGLSNLAGCMNTFVLIDYRDEYSVEATVMLDDADHLSAFETNEELLAFASLNA